MSVHVVSSDLSQSPAFTGLLHDRVVQPIGGHQAVGTWPTASPVADRIHPVPFQENRTVWFVTVRHEVGDMVDGELVQLAVDDPLGDIVPSPVGDDAEKLFLNGAERGPDPISVLPEMVPDEDHLFLKCTASRRTGYTLDEPSPSPSSPIRAWHGCRPSWSSS